MRRHLRFWRETLEASPHILSVIEHGYKIPFRYNPPSFEFKNNKSALQNKEFVNKTLKGLLEEGKIFEVQKPFATNPLSVAEDPSGKKRLILDVSFLNQYLWKEKIKFDDWKVFEDFIDSDSEAYLFKFDLKSGYHHVDIHRDHQKFLGFSWSFKNEPKRYFLYSVLPFGLSSGPLIFTKIVRVLIKYWRAHGIRIACFLDDGLSVDYSKPKAKENSIFVAGSLQKSGFITNEEKSEWEPVTRIQWLGIQVDFENKTYTISEKRIISLIKSLEDIFDHPTRTSARQLSCVAGKIVSMKFVLGNVIRLKTRLIYKLIEARVSWDKRINLTLFHDVLQELLFWKLNLRDLNKRAIIKYEIPDLKVFSDASATGVGAILNEKVCYRNLKQLERGESSTFRELLAIKYAIDSFDVLLGGKTILWHTDNIGTAIIVRVGSNRDILQELANGIYLACKKKDVKLTVTWISRDQNEKADKVSKTIDYDDWLVRTSFVQTLERKWGKFSIDLFADSNNAKCDRFCSKYCSPGCFRVDAFSFDWSGEFCYIVPPVYLIPKAIKHFLASRGRTKGVLIVPFWPSAVFWPYLIKREGIFKDFVRETIFYRDSRHFVSQGEYKGSVLGDGKLVIPFYVLLIDNFFV